MDNYLLLGAGRRPKRGPKHGPTQREVLAGRIAHGPVGPIFVTAPPVAVERPGTVRITGTARADVTVFAIRIKFATMLFCHKDKAGHQSGKVGCRPGIPEMWPGLAGYSF